MKNQGSFGPCWAFATLGSLESSLWPGTLQDFSEDNVARTAGFDDDPYSGGGHYWMSTASLRRAGRSSRPTTPSATPRLRRGSSHAPICGTRGTLSCAGYHTIVLTAPLEVTGRQPFSVILHLATPGYSWPMAMEYAETGYSSAASSAGGQSFASTKGTSWTDVGPPSNSTPMNVCLKAFSTYPGADTTPPSTTTKAFAAAVRVRKTVALECRVNDAAPGCGRATAVSKIFRGKKLKKTLKGVSCPTNVKASYR